jgi:hypothetical protein
MCAGGRAHSRVLCGCSGESALGAVEEATAEAAKHGDHSELLAALVAEARVMIEQAKAVQAERAKAAAVEAAAAAAAAVAAERARVAAEEAATATAERQLIEERLAALALETQQMQAQLGSSVVPPAAPDPAAEETMCVVCMDAPKDRIVLPCMHLCACGPCAQRLLELDASCPVCRGPVERMAQVFS